MKSWITPGSLAMFIGATILYWMSMYLYMPILAVHSERNVGASMGVIGIILASYGLAQLVLRLPLGIWSDRLGRRRPFVVAGTAAAALGALVMGLAPDPFWMTIGRGLSGVGAAGWVAYTVLFASYFPAERAGRALSLITFTNSASILVANFAGGIIADQLGWYAPFMGAAALGFLATVLATQIAEKPMAPRKGVDPRELLRICTVPSLLSASVVAALSTWTMWAVVNGFTPLYAANLGATRSELGVLATAGQAANAVCTLASPFLAERLGVKPAVIFAILVQAAGTVMVPFVGSFEMILLSQMLGSGGRALLYPATMSLSINSVSPADRATAMGVYQAVYAMGMFAGPATSGFFGDAFGISSVFFIGAAVTLVGIPVMLARKSAAS